MIGQLLWRKKLQIICFILTESKGGKLKEGCEVLKQDFI